MYFPDHSLHPLYRLKGRTLEIGFSARLQPLSSSEAKNFILQIRKVGYFINVHVGVNSKICLINILRAA